MQRWRWVKEKGFGSIGKEILWFKVSSMKKNKKKTMWWIEGRKEYEPCSRVFGTAFVWMTAK